jgi:Fe2+ transport system protein B
MQVPVVGTVAIRDVGVDKLISRIEEKKVGNIEELANECRG